MAKERACRWLHCVRHFCPDKEILVMSSSICLPRDLQTYRDESTIFNKTCFSSSCSFSPSYKSKPLHQTPPRQPTCHDLLISRSHVSLVHITVEPRWLLYICRFDSPSKATFSIKTAIPRLYVPMYISNLRRLFLPCRFFSAIYFNRHYRGAAFCFFSLSLPGCPRQPQVLLRLKNLFLGAFGGFIFSVCV